MPTRKVAKKPKKVAKKKAVRPRTTAKGNKRKRAKVPEDLPRPDGRKSRKPTQYAYAAGLPDKPSGQGRKAKVIDWDLVEDLALRHCSVAEIASAVGLTPEGLAMRKEFFPIYERAYHQGNINLRQIQYAMAEAGNATMVIWLSKNWLGQTDRHDHRVQDVTSPQPQQRVIDVSNLSSEDLRDLRRIIQKADRGSVGSAPKRVGGGMVVNGLAVPTTNK